MKKLIVILVPVIVVCAAALLFALLFGVQSASAPSGDAKAEQYVTEHFSELSPDPAKLGGTFYVTRIEAAEGKGVVEYEDGHIALTADFTYSIASEGTVHITSFLIR